MDFLGSKEKCVTFFHFSECAISKASLSLLACVQYNKRKRKHTQKVLKKMNYCYCCSVLEGPLCVVAVEWPSLAHLSTVPPTLSSSLQHSNFVSVFCNPSTSFQCFVTHQVYSLQYVKCFVLLPSSNICVIYLPKK